MKIKFWGVRGSIPTPQTSKQIQNKIFNVLKLISDENISSTQNIKEFIKKIRNYNFGTFGGNTPCIQLKIESLNNSEEKQESHKKVEDIIILDMGSGLRELGNEITKKYSYEQKINIHIFITHTHWDHIQGFPFFKPVFNPNITINFYSPLTDLRKRLEHQQHSEFFPINLDYMIAKKKFIHIEPEKEISILLSHSNDKFIVKNIELYHPGKSYAFRIEHNEKSIVYATDGEYFQIPPSFLKRYVKFFNNADLIIFDTQYNSREEREKIDWGHSSTNFAVDISVRSNVKTLALFHYAPEKDDQEICGMLKHARNYLKAKYPESKLKIILSKEQEEIKI